jgi:hypothetical protein
MQAMTDSIVVEPCQGIGLDLRSSRRCVRSRNCERGLRAGPCARHRAVGRTAVPQVHVVMVHERSRFLAVQTHGIAHSDIRLRIADGGSIAQLSVLRRLSRQDYPHRRRILSSDFARSVREDLGALLRAGPRRRASSSNARAIEAVPSASFIAARACHCAPVLLKVSRRSPGHRERTPKRPAASR